MTTWSTEDRGDGYVTLTIRRRAPEWVTAAEALVMADALLKMFQHDQASAHIRAFRDAAMCAASDREVSGHTVD